MTIQKTTRDVLFWFKKCMTRNRWRSYGPSQIVNCDGFSLVHDRINPSRIREFLVVTPNSLVSCVGVCVHMVPYFLLYLYITNTKSFLLVLNYFYVEFPSCNISYVKTYIYEFKQACHSHQLFAIHFNPHEICYDVWYHELLYFSCWMWICTMRELTG